MTTPRQLLDTSCFVCGNRHTLTLFICDYHFEETYAQVHPTWLDADYLARMQDEAKRMDERDEAARQRRAEERKAAA
jgi:hypothetical protein